MNWLRERLRRWLGIGQAEADVLTLGKRVSDIARHFVIERDAAGMPLVTLADQHADQDGKPRPGPFPIRGNWQMRKRFLEANAAVRGKRN